MKTKYMNAGGTDAIRYCCAWIFFMLWIGFPFMTEAQQKPSTCPNMDFSQGNFSNWVGKTSVYPSNWPDANNCSPANNVFMNCPAGIARPAQSGNTCNGCYSYGGLVPQPSGALGPVPYYLNTGIVPGRHTIITTSNPDPYACNNIMTLPSGEPFCARLGNGGQGNWGNGVGWQIDYLQYTFTVTQANSLLTYKYAVVLQDPLRDPTNPAHTPDVRPRFNVYLRNQAGQLIDPTCGKFEVVYDTTLTGFRECPLNQIQGFGGNPYAPVGTAYRAWTTVGVDLRPFMGQTLTLEFNTWDCGWGGHFGYAYVTARCDSLAILVKGCNPDGSATLTAPPGFAYKWFPNGETTQSINVLNASPGDTVRVELTTNNGCKTDLYTVIYPTVTNAVFDANPKIICVNQNIAFRDSSNSYYTGNNSAVPIAGWSWDFGDGGTSTVQHPVHTYTVPGDYTVTLMVTNSNGCTDTTTRQVKVLPLPVPDFTVADVCINSPVQFQDMSTSAGGPITLWDWNFGDGSTSTLQNPIHLYKAPGTYTINLKVTVDGGCSKDTFKTVKVWPIPRALFTAQDVCLGNPTPFQNLSVPGDPNDPLVSFIWNFGDNSPLFSGQMPYHIYTASGTYKVTLITSTQRGCVHDTSFNVNVLPDPTAGFTYKGGCLGTPFTFTDLSKPAGTVTSWRWDFGDNTPASTSQNPTHVFGTAGYYPVQLWVSTSFGCKDSITVMLDIPPLPEVDFNSDKYEGCSPLCVQFSDYSYSPYDTIVSWQWDFGDGNGSKLANPPHCYMNPGVYTVSLKITTKMGCSQSYTFLNMIRVYPHPKSDFDFTPLTTSEFSPVFEFTDLSSGADFWRWTFGDSTVSTVRNPTHTYDGAGEYTVWQFVRNQYNCVDSSFKVVVVTPEWAFYIPNVFTPNNDGKNDFFIGKGFNITRHEMWIFDRWGDLVYTTGETPDPESAIPWNGHVNNGERRAQADVYVWKVKLRDVHGKNHEYIGRVTLVR